MKNVINDGKVTIGMVTEQLLQKMFDEGDICSTGLKKFYEGVRALLCENYF